MAEVVITAAAAKVLVAAAETPIVITGASPAEVVAVVVAVVFDLSQGLGRRDCTVAVNRSDWGGGRGGRGWLMSWLGCSKSLA